MASPSTKSTVFVTVILGGEIRGHDAREVFLRNALTVIDDRDTPPFAIGLRFCQPVELHADLRSRGRGIDGIGNQIGDQSLDEHFVHFHERLLRRVGEDFHVPVAAGPGDIRGLVDDEVEAAELQIGPEIFGEEKGFLDISPHGGNVAQGDRQQFVVQGFGVAVFRR